MCESLAAVHPVSCWGLGAAQDVRLDRMSVRTDQITYISLVRCMFATSDTMSQPSAVYWHPVPVKGAWNAVLRPVIRKACGGYCPRITKLQVLVREMGMVFPYPYCEEFPLIRINLENPLKTVNSVMLEISRDYTTGEYVMFALEGMRGRVRTRITHLTKQLEAQLSHLAMDIENLAFENRIPYAAFMECKSCKAHSTPGQGELWSANLLGGKLYNLRLLSSNNENGSTLFMTPGPLKKGMRVRRV